MRAAEKINIKTRGWIRISEVQLFQVQTQSNKIQTKAFKIN